ncbi:carbohydrate ABC transporter permease [Paenibacillus flagellatus]|uniref:Carbohydrate ABC transporter permease n=1 Tax=Paenibacillus flagellatus TaxID=2211139 RepID=A0A2V5K7W8_9BACL|nr:carbohydrate ABC transporter permease [Paenibacillus flagellatus]PYI55551.1 carbohydrate ABC transporter permease [Paenibacillus flagellatus]
MRAKETAGIIGKLDYKNPGIKLLYWCLFAVLIGISLVCLLPPLWILSSSVKDIKEFFAIPPTLFPRTFEWGKLWDTWRELDFTRLYVNTFMLTIGKVLFSLLFNGILGYFLAVLKPAGSKLVFVLVLWTMLLPNTLGMVPIFKNIIDFPVFGVNLTNTFWPMWMMAGANAFYVIIFKGFFEGIPQALIDAAKMDGGTRLSIFFRIVVPLSKPVIMAVTIFTVNAAWADFFWPYMVLKDKNMWTVIVAIFNLKTAVPLDMQFIALTFAIIPPALLFLFFQRYIMQGFTFSGIRG